MQESKLLSLMVETQIEARGIRDPGVISALKRVPRELFVPSEKRAEAFEDRPLPIGYGQTISQPYIVALMTSTLNLQGREKVLEIGTGCGYQTAVLALIAEKIFTIEYRKPLFERSRRILEGMGYSNIHFRLGDGFYGIPEEAPFDGIIVTAGAPKVPSILLSQLAEGGKLVIPLGNPDLGQDLILFTRYGSRIERKNLGAVRFVPMAGRINIKD